MTLTCVAVVLALFVKVWLNHRHPAIAKARVAYVGFICLGALSILFGALMLPGIPTSGICNFRHWFINGGYIAIVA